MHCMCQEAVVAGKCGEDAGGSRLSGSNRSIWVDRACSVLDTWALLSCCDLLLLLVVGYACRFGSQTHQTLGSTVR